MKTFKSYILLSFIVLGLGISCKDEDLILVPEWETAVHGNASLTPGSAEGFIYKDPSKEVTIDLQWVSIDNKSQVTKIEIYALLNETYIDIDGNPKTAKIGGDDGRLLTSFEGGEVPGNRESVTFTVNQTNLFAIYQDAQFDYDGPSEFALDSEGKPTSTCIKGCNAPVAVFNNPAKPERNATDRFIPDDAVKIRWEFTTDDGRVFDAWGVSVCTEFPGANCSVDFTISCAPAITSPGANGGVYEINMIDSYGDGWNGAAIKVILDGVATEYTIDDGGSGLAIINVPPTATSLFFEFISGDWDSEVFFTIKSPKGNIIAKAGPSPAEGPIKLNLCKE